MSKRVAIVGLGITGLSAAYHLTKLMPELRVSVFEASDRAGGWIRTIPARSEMRNCRSEVGPRTIRPSGISGLITLKMVHELGLQSQVASVPKSHPAARNRFVLYQDELNKMPSSLGALFLNRPPVLKGILRAIVKDLTTRRGHKEDESISEFISRRFGAEIDEKLVSAIVHGIYAGDSAKLSIKSCFPRLWELEKTYGSVIRGLVISALSQQPETQRIRQYLSAMSPDCRSFVEGTMKQSIYSFTNGMETLTRSMLQNISSNPGCGVSFGSTCRSIQAVEKNKIRLSTINPTRKVTTEEEFDHIIFSIPAFQMLQIGGFEDVKYLLSQYAYANVSVMTVVEDDTHKIPDGFGFLVPKSENSKVLGVVFDTKSGLTTDPPGVQKLTVMSKLQREEDVMTELARSTLSKYLPGGERTESAVHCEALVNCIPHYTVGHSERVSKIREMVDPRYITLSGASFDGVSVNDCVYSGYKAAHKVKALLK